MTMPKKNRRQMVVDGELYHWNDRKETIVIQRAPGGAYIKAIPLAIMLPRHVEACIRFAVGSGWSPADAQQLWLAFYLDPRQPDVSRFQRIARDAQFILHRESGNNEWYLPVESGQEWRPGKVRDAPDSEPGNR